MNAISESCNHGHNILELAVVLPNVSFAINGMERDYF